MKEFLEMDLMDNTQEEFKAKWIKCLEFIKDNINSDPYNMFFEPIEFLGYEKNTLSIRVPSQFFVEYIEENYASVLGSAINKNFSKDTKLSYRVRLNKSDESSIVTNVAKPSAKQKKNQVMVSPSYNKTEDGIRNPFLHPGSINITDSQLNADYTFDTFVEGECNKLAYAAGKAIAEGGTTTYNPLFIHGKSGFGKTHLVQAIGAAVKEKSPKKNVLYVDAETFERQFVEATTNNDRANFVHFYQNIDVLILDDVQSFAKKEGTQNVFFQIFNYIHQKGKQIILTSDCAPVELQGLSERLLTRFKWGLTAELLTPNYETRLAILKRHITKSGLEFDEEIIEYVANHVSNSVRELEGAICSIMFAVVTLKKPLNLDLAKEVVEKIVKSTQQDISIDFIKKTVCDYFNIAPDQLKSKTRKREIVQSRQVAMYFAKIYTKNSLASIGSQIGGKDHATVLHACKTVNNLIETDKRFKRFIVDLEKRFKLQ